MPGEAEVAAVDAQVCSGLPVTFVGHGQGLSLGSVPRLRRPVVPPVGPEAWKPGGVGVPSWDENVVADVRAYDELSPVVGLIALISAAHAWRDAAIEAPHDVPTLHPEAGAICAYDIVQRNAHEVSHHLWDVQRAIPGSLHAD